MSPSIDDILLPNMSSGSLGGGGIACTFIWVGWEGVAGIMEWRFDELLAFFHQLDFFGFFGSGDESVGVEKIDALSVASLVPCLWLWLWWAVLVVYEELRETRDRKRRIDVGRPPGDCGGDTGSSGDWLSAAAGVGASEGGGGGGGSSMSSGATWGRLVPAVRLSNLGRSSCSDGTVEVPMIKRACN